MNEWRSPEHALSYLSRADQIPHRAEGEATLLEELPRDSKRILDLGSGAGRLLNLILLHCPAATAVALDFSPTMLDKLRENYASDPRVEIVEHDLSESLPQLGQFDAVVSSFAIHHVSHERKRALYGEVWHMLPPGGIFCNLEHVDSATPGLHQRFLEILEIDEEDPSNILLDVETQLRWLHELGFSDVDCYWKWRELALLIGKRPE